MLLSAVAAVGLFLSGASASAQTTTVAGVTPGAIAVDESGSANYSIPLSVPPGVAGMAPSLSLIYGSRGDNGILGVGWSLGGLSVIHRCGKTLAQDDEIDGVDYSADDRFCLDGQRLVATDGGVYGAAGTTYSTELASFSKIVSYGTAGTGPAYFKVWTKSGQIMTYGNTDDSAVEVPGQPVGQATVRYWSVNRIEDRVGNYLTLSYSDDTTNNVHQIDRIDYAGNDDAQPVTLPTASVRFVYEARNDTRLHYMAGVRTQTLNRLKAIETYAQHGGVDTLVKRYDMAYEYGKATGRSRLTSLTECDASNNCLAPHSFTYSDHSAGNAAFVVDSNYTLPDVIQDKQLNLTRGRFVDVNGDGLVDWLRAYRTAAGSESQKAWINLGHGWLRDDSHKLPDIIQDVQLNLRRGEFMDVNGDGLSDWLRAYRTAASSESQKAWLSLENGWLRDDTYMLPDIIEDRLLNLTRGRFVDVNGDGLTDWLRAYRTAAGSSSQKAWINLGNGWLRDDTYKLPDFIEDLKDGVTRGQFQDVNGDGLDDWVRAYRKTSGSSSRITWLNTGSGWVIDPDYALPDFIDDKKDGVVRGQFQDVNGDGLVDWVRAYRKASGSYSVITWLNTGAGWVIDPNYALPDFIDDKKDEVRRGQFQDVNGDGLVDWVRAFRKASGSHSVITWLNTGSGWSINSDYALPDFIDDKKDGVVRGEFQDVNGDGVVDWVRAFRKASGGSQSQVTWINQSGIPDLLVSAKDGLGRMAEITYKPLTDSSVYTKGSGASFPEVDIQAPMYVVASVSQDDGKTETPGNLEGDAVINYTYAGAKVNAQGRGFLGFRTVTARDEQTGILTTTNYRQDYPFTGQVDNSVTRLDNGAVVDLIKEVESVYATKEIFDGAATNQPSVFFPYASSSTSKAYEISRVDSLNNQLPGFLVSSTKTDTFYDDFGNVTRIEQEVQDAAVASEVYSTTTVSEYTNDEVNWILGRVTSTTVTKSRPGAANQSRKSAWEYNASNGLLTKEIIEPDLQALKVTTSYTYDVFGNETAVTVDGDGVTARTSTTSYDTSGQFPLSSANALGHSETMVTDARFGVVTSLTGPNGIATTWEYDGFGRKTKELRADGTESQIAYELCDAACQPGAVYKITTQDFLTAGGTALNTPSVQYYDKMNRVFRTESIAFDGITKIYVDTRYDPRGESHMVSRPYFEGATPLWATTHYDILSRRMSVMAPDGGIQEFDYSGLSTQTTNALFQTETKTQNAIGELILSEGHSDINTPVNRVSYSYDAYGNLLETVVEDPDNSVTVTTSMSYDQRGRKTGMTDPDMGVWSYSYNVLGELISQTDAKNQVVTMAYDILGRMTSRVEAEGTTNWTFDTATKGIGKIHQVSGPNGYLEVATYDSLGRPDTTATTISGTVYNTSLTYDAQGRPDTITYPSGFAVKNNYTANGFLGSVSEVLGGTVYWQANTVDAEGMVTQETLGNGVVTSRAYDPATALLSSIQTTKSGNDIQDLSFVFDTLGNLTERKDLTQNRKEVFAYDGLNRVLSTTLTDTSTTSTLNTTTYSYDALGNITFKSDVGAYLYGQNGAGPHAVTTAGANTYTYDANGSMITGAGRTTAWTSFNKPQNIADSATGNWTSFVYGPSRARIQQNAQTNNIVTTTDYVGSSYERRYRLNEPDELVHYVRAGGGTVAIYTRTVDNGSTVTDKTRYLHKDHLGSVESITDEQGVVTEHLSYDAHGKRRQSDWSAGAPAIPSETPRGFTGHEHLDGVGLIHMNGRVYDPTLGRFLSADPNVQAPDDTQSFNRYTYVKNNPLSYTDPSGFFFKKLFKKIKEVFSKLFKGIASFAKKALQNEYVQLLGQNLFGGVGAAAFSGLVTLANGGSLSDALKAAAVTFVTTALTAAVNFIPGLQGAGIALQIAIKSVAHGVIGGVTATLRGGQFAGGFLSGAFAGAAGAGFGALNLNGVASIAGAAVAGGIGAELGGGKFKNGAISGAFSALAATVVSKFVVSSEGNAQSIEGGPDISTEGTAEERQARYDKARKIFNLNDPDDISFEDQYAVLTKDGDGNVLSVQLENDFAAAQRFINQPPVDSAHSKSWLNGVYNLNGEGKIIIYRGGVVGTKGLAIFGPKIKFGPWSAIDNAILTVGHELAHKNGIDLNLGNNVPHSNANLFGWRACKKAGYCTTVP